MTSPNLEAANRKEKQGQVPYSLGCHACRRMKVKCDTKKPQCTRCIKAGRACPGYRDIGQVEVVFRSMNTLAAIKAGTFRLSKTRITTAVHEQNEPDAIELPIQLHRSSLSYIKPTPDWDSRAISHFLYNYSSKATLEWPGYLGFLPELLSEHTKGPQIESAVLAAGYTSLANVTGISHILQSSRKHYGRAVRALYTTLDDSRIASSDMALTSIVLLQMFGALTSQPIRTQLWQLLRAASQCSNSMHLLLSKPQGTCSKNQLLQALDRAFVAHLQIASWQQNLPQEWTYQSYGFSGEGNDSSNKHAMPGKLYTFDDVHQGAMWIGIWCAQVHLLRTLIKVSSLRPLQSCLAAAVQSTGDFEKRLYAIVNDVCASVPYMMNNVDELGLPRVTAEGKALGAFFLLRALYVVNSVDQVSLAQKGYILETLRRISYAKGIKSALRAMNKYMP